MIVLPFGATLYGDKLTKITAIRHLPTVSLISDI